MEPLGIGSGGRPYRQDREARRGRGRLATRACEYRQLGEIDAFANAYTRDFKKLEGEAGASSRQGVGDAQKVLTVIRALHPERLGAQPPPPPPQKKYSHSQLLKNPAQVYPEGPGLRRYIERNREKSELLTAPSPSRSTSAR